ncbi:MAG TPA: rhodanese-like domain-containing protein [Bacilli bacterium]|nr:rhodanese-like domain-containing protein [Bacilli bacterium]
MAKIVNITAEQVRERLERGDDILIVDVREDGEVGTGMIPGALHIPVGDMEDRYDEIDPEREAIIVCRSGRRSKSVCNYLQAKGYENVLNMVDGMLKWSGEKEEFYP